MTTLLNSVYQEKEIKDSPNMRLSSADMGNMEQTIGSIYNEYQEFICIGQDDKVKEMPAYKLHFKQYNQDLGLAAVEYEDGIYHLYVSDKTYKSKERTGILFHEFTHIYDREFLYNKWKLSKDTKLGNVNMHIYTEIHAEQIRLLSMLGCNTIDEIDIKVDYNRVIQNMEGKEVSFYEYLKGFRKQLIKCTDEGKKIALYKGKINEIGLRSLIDKIAYYIGALSIYVKYCNYGVDELKDLSYLSDFWERDMEVFRTSVVCNLSDLVNLYCNKDIKNLCKNEICDSGTLLMHNWKKNARENLHIIDK